jgi:hypothetical protein
MPNLKQSCILIMILSAWIATPTCAAPSEDPFATHPDCQPNHVGEVVKEILGQAWNKGTVRAWQDQGEFLSMPMGTDAAKWLKTISENLPTKLSSRCNVIIANEGSYTVRVTSKTVDELKLAKFEARAAHPNSANTHANTPNLINADGTTLGVFSPIKGEVIMILYPAKIAAAIARNQGTPFQSSYSKSIAKVSANLDLEYNFGDTAVKAFCGSGKLSMREAAAAAFSDLTSLGYRPEPSSEKSVKMFDGFIIPETHESFWVHETGIARIYLKKKAHGKVKIDINETKRLK